MFLDESIPLDRFDAPFFSIGGAEAVALDPNQRQLLEVVYEGLENAGIPLEKVDGQPVACFVAAFASDYGDMQFRDPEDFPPNVGIGVGRAIQANRISHFLNIKGPSVTLDTGCSGSLVGLDMAVRALQTGQANAAIVASSNLYLNPDHVVDNRGTMGKAHSPSGLCHTFDALADGYIKAEGVGCVVIKRLADAVRDRDPIRAVVLGTGVNSDGRTNGISSPSAEAQTAAIMAAYQNAGITNLNDTQYLECHGTGTPAGDPIEVRGVGDAFASTRDPDKPLIIGSIKGNVGHTEPVAGLAGLVKTVLAIEHAVVPGNPLFVTPNPHIDFVSNRVKVSRTAIPWPDTEGKPKRASINSFGYGGTNAHAVIQEADVEHRGYHVHSIVPPHEAGASESSGIGALDRPHTVVLSANDASSLKNNIQSLVDHLNNPRVKVDLADVAYTLSERRTHLWHRAFITTRATRIDASNFTIGKKADKVPKIGFVFTGQGAQWPQMGKQLLECFPWTRSILEELDAVLQSVPNPPKWSLVEELTEPRSVEHVRKPEYSQPLVTALQICIIAVFEVLGVKPSSVVGHSSGEIAAAYTAGFLDRAGAIKAAFYRGWATVINADAELDGGMLAVGLDVESVAPFLDRHQGKAWIACYNSPQSLTISGKKDALVQIADEIKTSGNFARLLQVDMAYHSQLMEEFGAVYERLLTSDKDFAVLDSPPTCGVTMFSSVTAEKLTDVCPTDAHYWKTNMISPVRFSKALAVMATQPGDESPDFLIEIGPSGALAGPISQVLTSLSKAGQVSYCSAWTRGDNAVKALHDVAGSLFVAGYPVHMACVNGYDSNRVRTIVDLPNYSWNHSVRYWHENAASGDWRFRQFAHHDLIGSKIFGVPWQYPIWRKHLRLEDVPWLRDHQIGPDVLMPGAGLVTMAVEAMYQKYCALNPEKAVPSANELVYQLRHIHFDRAMVVEKNETCTILVTLFEIPDNKGWDEFRISTTRDDVMILHCWGRIRVMNALDDKMSEADLQPLDSPTSFSPWYKAMGDANVFFGPSFRKVLSLEAIAGEHSCRALVDLTAPPSRYEPASYFPIHPAPFDASLQVGAPPSILNERSLIDDVMVPGTIDEVILNRVPKDVKVGLAIAEAGCTSGSSEYKTADTRCDVSIHDPKTGVLYFQAKGMRYVKIDVEKKPDPHTFNCVSWKPDISLLTQDQLMYLDPEDVGQASKIDAVIDLIAHRRPMLKVLEINLDTADKSSLWFSPKERSARLACIGCDLATTSSETIAALERDLGVLANSAFRLISPGKKGLGLVVNKAYDLVIVKSHSMSGIPIEEIIANIKPILVDDAFVLVVGPSTNNTLAATDSGYESSNEGSVGGVDATSSPDSQSEKSSFDDGSSHASSVSSAPMDDGEGRKLLHSSPESFWSRRKQLEKMAGQGFQNVLEVAEGGNVHYLCRNKSDSQCTNNQGGYEEVAALPRNLTVVAFKHSSRPLPPSLHEKLEYSGWTVRHERASALATVAAPNTTVFLVLDELSGPVLAQASGSQWENLKRLTASGNPVVWVTKGSQYKVTDPDNALVHGLFRVVRREDTTARLITLDVQSATSLATAWVLDKILELVRTNMAETEYAERNGVVFVQRLMPDAKVNAFKRGETDAGQPVVKGLHEEDGMLQLDINGQLHGREVVKTRSIDMAPDRSALQTLQLREDASYLIIGGLKGLCGSLALHMARHGAKHIISCSRSGTSDAASSRIIKGCRAYGCAVTEAKGDVADSGFVRSLFKQYRGGPRITGIIQGAMVLRDRTYETMTVEDFHQALEAKVKGTWNLHRAAVEQRMTLDFFTMLSSVSGVIGNKGQANYAAANTFLDAFASYRRGLGLRANSVDLGAIEDVGFLAEQGAGLQARFDKQQWTPIGERVLRQILTCSILQQDSVCPLHPVSAAQLVTGIAFPLALDGASDLGSDSRFGYLFSSGSSAVSGDVKRGSDHATVDQGLRRFKELVADDGADSATRVKACVEVMSRQVSRLLRLESDIESGKPLSAYGLDSMSAVELRSWIRAKIGAEVSTLDITNARSVVALCEKVVARLAN